MLKVAVLFLILVVDCLHGVPVTETNSSVDLGWKIIGGNTANTGDFPYQVSLRYADDSHFCGGTLITYRTILTAARCLVGKAVANTLVVVGTNILSSGGTRYQAASLRIHSGFSQTTGVNDIGLVIVTTGIESSGSVRTINPGSSSIGAGARVVLTGWGATSNPGPISTNLQVINLVTISNGECQSRLSAIGDIFDSQICTYTKAGEGICEGDAGGPLVTDNSVIGIISWGSPCARGFPDVFTRVSSYISWIEANQV